MASISVSTAAQSRVEDVLSQLPRSNVSTYDKGRKIYDGENLSNGLYLVLKGTVGVSHIADDGTDVLLEIVGREQLFGESAFLGAPRCSECATAIEAVELMTWSTLEVEDLVSKRPRLAVALLQVLARRNAEYSHRIESFANDTIERRLARSLIRLSERIGTADENGSVSIMPFTHQMLSRYVGTSREIVSHYMGRFRSQGHLSYSRQEIRLHLSNLKSVLD